MVHFIRFDEDEEKRVVKFQKTCKGWQCSVGNHQYPIFISKTVYQLIHSCFKAIYRNRSFINEYNSTPGLLTHNSKELKAYVLEQYAAALMPNKLLEKWVGTKPKCIEVSKWLVYEVAVLAHCAKITTSQERLRHYIKEISVFAEEVLIFIEYYMRERYARLSFARLVLGRQSVAWPTFKRRCVRQGLRLLFCDDVEFYVEKFTRKQLPILVA